MEVKVGPLKAMVGSLLLCGALGSLGDGSTFVAGLVAGLGLGTILGAFAPDRG